MATRTGRKTTATAKKPTTPSPGKKPHGTIKLTIHPAADIFPMLDPGELGELAESIKKFGLREKIVVTTEGVVVDGRNRLKALELAGIPLKDAHVTIVDFDQAPYSAEEYVVMANIERRNLNRQQRKELAGKLAIMLEKAQADKPKDEKQDTTKKAADIAGVSRRTAAEAKLAALVRTGLKEAPKPEEPSKHDPTKKKGVTKHDKGVPRPPSIVSSIRKQLDYVLQSGDRWSLDRKYDAVIACHAIIVKFQGAATRLGVPFDVNFDATNARIKASKLPVPEVSLVNKAKEGGDRS